MKSSLWVLRIVRTLSVLAVCFNLIPATQVTALGPIPDVLAWGYNEEGQASVPEDFANDIALAAGYFHNLALKADGTLWAWGMNVYGQLGNGSSDPLPHPIPAQVAGLGPVTSTTAGAYHSMVILSDGTVWGWGRNAQGQLGNGTITDSVNPLQVTGLGADGKGWARMIAGGWGHSLAVLTDGTVWGWGLNNMGQIGYVVEEATLNQTSFLWGNSFVLDPPKNLSLKTDPQIGDPRLSRNDGQTTLDYTVPFYSSTPVRVPILYNIAAVTAGYDHSIALHNNGTVWTWGDNAIGQLGIGTFDSNPHPFPVQVPGLTDVVAIAAGVAHSLALKSDGTVWAWGRNIEGELGNGTTTNAPSPVQVAVVSGPVRAIAAGGYHNLAVLSNDTLAAWGFNAHGQTILPVGISNASRVAAGLEHSLALLSDRPAWDVNGDHVINVLDVVQVGSRFGESGPPGWIPEDVNQDGEINVLDVVLVGSHFGETW